VAIARRPGSAAPKELWRALIQFSDEIGNVVDHLATLESRKRAGMAKRLILEALAARGLWDLETNEPRVPTPSPGARNGEHRRRQRG
jgi:hypothetical protein